MTAEFPPPPPNVPPGPPEPSTRKRAPLLIAALAGAVVGGGVVGAVWAMTGDSGTDAVGSEASASSSATQTAEVEPSTFILTGSFELTEGAVSDGSTGCKGTGGYDDIAEGTSVTVYDAAGTVIATGYLGDSTLTSGTCTFDVAVEDVPKGEDFYKVEVSHRGTVQLSGVDAEAGRFGATLG